LPERYFQTEDGWSAWALDESAQPLLRDGFVDTMCFQRPPNYYSTDVAPEDVARCEEMLVDGRPPIEQIRWNDRALTYNYTIINEFLPGPERRARKSGGTLFDLRIRDGETEYRLYDRLLRNMHSADAPFAVEPFVDGVELWRAEDGTMTRQTAFPFAPVNEFTDARPNRYQNPHLPFGGADIPEAGFGYTLHAPAADDPAGSVVRVDFRWR
jgi:immune inhibitor A